MARRGALPACRGALTACCALVLAACGESSRPETLVVRTDFPESVRDAVEEIFEASDTLVDLRFVVAEDWGAIDGGSSDGESSGEGGVDVEWGASAVALEREADAGRLLPYRPAWNDVPFTAIPPESEFWAPVALTPFVIAFDRRDLTLARAPSDWIDVFHFRWADEIEVLDPLASHEGAGFVAAIVDGHAAGDDVLPGLDWLDRLDRQVDVYTPDVEAAITALRTGGARLAILPRADLDMARRGGADWLYYRLPESEAPLLVRGVGIRSATASEVVARAFVELVGTPEVTALVARDTGWYPAHGGFDRDDLAGFPDRIGGNWSPLSIDIDRIARQWDDWLDRWDREVRGS